MTTTPFRHYFVCQSMVTRQDGELTVSTRCNTQLSVLTGEAVTCKCGFKYQFTKDHRLVTVPYIKPALPQHEPKTKLVAWDMGAVEVPDDSDWAGWC